MQYVIPAPVDHRTLGIRLPQRWVDHVSQKTEIRCPIYGFIELNAWERDIISHSVFQRLRRIRQLGWTDLVYPGAMHTRFEHSLGVLQMATMLYDGIVSRSWDYLRTEFAYDEDGKGRHRQLVRLAALLHDIGHGPFSHVAEDLAPNKDEGPEAKPCKHEDYSVAIIRHRLRDVLEHHKANNNYGFSVNDVIGLIEGGPDAGRAALWHELISGQLDADRMDYLLRDAYHAGVNYRYDWQRIVNTVELVPDPETGTPRLGVTDGGRHAVEGLIIARYMLFSQVYFHKTRVILDYHLVQALRTLLPEGQLPRPVPEEIDEYLRWDDWRVLGELQKDDGRNCGEHGERLVKREFYRRVWETPEFPSSEDEARLSRATELLTDFAPVPREADKSWYNTEATDNLLISAAHSGEKTKYLSMLSTIVGKMGRSRRTRLYVRPEDSEQARALLKGTLGY